MDHVADAFRNMQPYRNAIAAIESRGSGDYSARGPLTRKGDRAYGRYQVMGANIPEWTTQALGAPMTPAQFIADPQAQDVVFDKQFGGYLKNHSPNDAAAMWFTGRPLAAGGAIARDVNNVTGAQYASRFENALGAAPGRSSPASPRGPAASPTLGVPPEPQATPMNFDIGDMLAMLAEDQAPLPVLQSASPSPGRPVPAPPLTPPDLVKLLLAGTHGKTVLV